ncbi:hypothetical protein ACROYT_G030798 [Oculina patagonica]
MPPGPRLTCLPFIGNLLSFDSGETLRESTASLRKKYGTLYTLKVGSFKLVVADDAESVKEVLVKKSADYAGRPPFYSFLMTTLGGKDIALGNYGPAWRFHRKLFMTAVRQYLSDQEMVEERISEQATRLVQYFEDQNGKGFDPGKDSNGKCCKHLFPVARYFPFPAYRSFQKMFDRIFEILRHQLKVQEKEFDPTAEIESLTGSLLKERIAAESEVGAEDKASILSDDYIINTLEDMFSASYETTSTTLR